MTREQKLALIIGFSLILAVGVLISDHLSRAQSDPIVADQAIDQPMVVHRLADVPPSLGEINRPAPGKDAVPMETIANSDSVVRETLPGMTSAGVPREVRTSPRETIASSRADETKLDNPREIAHGPSLEESVLDLSMFERVSGYRAPGVEIMREADASRDEGVREIARGDADDAKGVVRHTVTEGESLYSIANKYYGDSSLWPKLAEANTGRINENGHVLIDSEILIPAREGMRLPASITRVALKTEAKDESESVQFATYTIQKGDTLSEISQELMGTVRRMDELIKLNSDQINDANDIRVGMKLRYPDGERA